MNDGKPSTNEICAKKRKINIKPLKKLVWHGFKVHCFRKDKTTSTEAKEIMALNATLPKLDLVNIEHHIKITQEHYSQQHSNLEIISVTPFKSKAFGRFWTLEQKSCIVFYCRRKGFVPFLEKHFPTDVKGIPVDVRKGVVEFAAFQPSSKTIFNRTTNFETGTIFGTRTT